MNDDDITRFPPARCPHCGYEVDAAGTPDGSPGRPEPGDICGCIACGGVQVFTIDPVTQRLSLRSATERELRDLSVEQRRELARVKAFAERIYQPSKGTGRN